jgi:leucine-rich repeat protein SHOC2
MFGQNNSIRIDMSNLDLSKLPGIIDNLSYLIELNLDDLQLAKLENIICSLSYWRQENKLITLPGTSNDEQTRLPENPIDGYWSEIDYLVGDELLETLTKPDHYSMRSTGMSFHIIRVMNPQDTIFNYNSMGGASLDSHITIITNPQDTIRKLTILTGLKLEDSRLTGLVETISYCSVSDGCSGENIKPLNLDQLDLRYNQLTSFPQVICDFTYLKGLNLEGNQLTSLPESMKNLSNLEYLNLGENQLISLPEIFDKFSNLHELYLHENQLTSLPETMSNLTYLTDLCSRDNQLTSLPEKIGNLPFLEWLYLENNQLTSLPESIGNLADLFSIDLRNNPLTNLPKNMVNLANLNSIRLGDTLEDLSVLKDLLSLEDDSVEFAGASYLPRRYWTKLSDWKPEWLLDENNAEIRRILVERVGYEQICSDLNAIILDTWREYTLLKIDGVEAVYEYHEDEHPIDREPMVLLKMTCPSTRHVHILRVPPEMVCAEEAITWVNHGIHPDSFSVQT